MMLAPPTPNMSNSLASMIFEIEDIVGIHKGPPEKKKSSPPKPRAASSKPKTEKRKAPLDKLKLATNDQT